MVKFSCRQGVALEKAEIRFYKSFSAAKRFWESLPEDKRLDFSDYRGSEVSVVGEGRVVAAAKYYC